MFSSQTLATPAGRDVVKDWEESYRKESESPSLPLHRTVELTQKIVNGALPRLTLLSLHTAAAPKSGAAVGEETREVCEEKYFDDGKGRGGNG